MSRSAAPSRVALDPMTIQRRRSTRHDQANGMVAAAVVLTSLLATPPPPLAAQQVIELPAADRLLDADFEDLYQLGTLEGGGWDTFGSVEGLGFDGVGNLYILDTQAVRISVVDPDGNLVRRFIGEGEGPGEFGSNRIMLIGNDCNIPYDNDLHH